MRVRLKRKCKCGCGEFTNWNKQNKKYNNYIYNHGVKGIPLTEEHKRKIARHGKDNHMFGKKHSEESKIKMRGRIGKISHKKTWFKAGENNPAWEGGKSFRDYGLTWTKTLKKSIMQRDEYTCQTCGFKDLSYKNTGRVLDTHHIDYNKKNNDPVNMITLCKSCHGKAGYNRDYWENFFKAVAIDCTAAISKEVYICG